MSSLDTESNVTLLRMVMPCSVKYSVASSWTIGSSRFKMLDSMLNTVTFVPSFAYRLANSRPIGPAPIIPNVLGWVGNCWISVLL